MEGKLKDYYGCGHPTSDKDEKTAVIEFENGFIGYFWDFDEILTTDMIGKQIRVKLLAMGSRPVFFKLDEKYEIHQTSIDGWAYRCKGKVIEIDNQPQHTNSPLQYIVDVGKLILYLDLSPNLMINADVGDFIDFTCRIDIIEVNTDN